MKKGIVVPDLVTILEANDLAVLSMARDLCSDYYANTFYNKAQYIYFKNPESPLLLQAHVDTVRTKNSKLKLMNFRNVLFNSEGILGADDRLGVWIALTVLNLALKQGLPIPNIIFTNGEESGSDGMKTLCKQIVAKQVSHINMAIALDRRGSTEYVSYNHLPKEVGTYIETFGWTEHTGSYSDISVFTEKFLIPSVNISIGYYGQHTANEHIHLDEADLAIRRLMCVIKDPIDKLYPSKKKENVYTNYYGRSYGGYCGKNGWFKKEENDVKVDWVYVEEDRIFLARGLVKNKHGVWHYDKKLAEEAIKELDEDKSKNKGMVQCTLCKTLTPEKSLTLITVDSKQEHICKVCLSEVQARELRERIDKRQASQERTFCECCGESSIGQKTKVLHKNQEQNRCNDCVEKEGKTVVLIEDKRQLNLNTNCDVTRCEICLNDGDDVKFHEDYEMTLCQSCYDITSEPDKPYCRQEA